MRGSPFDVALATPQIRKSIMGSRLLLIVVALTAVLFACTQPGAVEREVTPTSGSIPTLSPSSPTPTPPISPEGRMRSYSLPNEDGSWTLAASQAGQKPMGTGTVRIEGLGEFSFEASEVETLRPDIFQPGHFSLFDIVVHLARRGDIALEYHFDKSTDTHVIDTINGQGGWWYEARYSGGWAEENVFRMDMYPYKNGTQMRLYRERDQRLPEIYGTFQEEVTRLARNGGQVIIPEVVIRTPDEVRTLRDVVVIAHNIRSDVLQPGVVTALDALLSLGEQGELSHLRLTWYDRIGTADPVDSYWVERIDEAEAYATCGFVYETGPREFPGFSGSHIHIPSDVRATVSPEYAFWFWICL